MRLKNKVAFVTGGASGPGKAAAVLFANMGAKVAVADINEMSGKKTVADICDAGGEAIYVYTDVSNATNVQVAIDIVIRELGGLHILYNGAVRRPDKEKSRPRVMDDTVCEAFKVEFGGTWLCSQYGIPKIVASGGGCIINTTSIFDHTGTHIEAAAMGAIVALTRSMAAQYASLGVRVNALAISPNNIERSKFHIEDDHSFQSIIGQPLEGFLNPQRVAGAALFLATDDSAGVTGHILVVDGGASLATAC